MLTVGAVSSIQALQESLFATQTICDWLPTRWGWARIWTFIALDQHDFIGMFAADVPDLLIP
jgi:hypothetical protein